MTDSYRYDAFVSYRQQEPVRSWVRNVLVPQLEAAGVRVCVDYRCFQIGEPFVTEMERAVMQSRFTVAVLTPGYFESGFTEFENVLADHLALEEQARRLLMVRREECEAPARLRYRLWLEMRTDAEVDDGLPRLIDALGPVSAA